MKLKFKFSLQTVLFIALIFLVSCGASEETTSQSQAAPETFFAVSVTPAVSGQIQDYLETNGEVISKVSVDVFPDNGGKITRWVNRLGEFVTANQIIGYVDPSRPGQNFSLSPIRAPISGTITSLPLKAGTTVSMQTAVAKISRLDQLEIVTYVAERFFSKVKLGEQALIKFDAYPGETFEGKVFELAPFIDPFKKTLELKLNITRDEQSRLLKMGMFAKIRLIVEEKPNVVKIPSSAVVRRENDSYVFVVQDERPASAQVEMDGAEDREAPEEADFVKRWAEQRKIKEGIISDGQIEVLSGLNAGELVVVRGQSSLGNGSGVRIIEEVINPVPMDLDAPEEK